MLLSTVIIADLASAAVVIPSDIIAGGNHFFDAVNSFEGPKVSSTGSIYAVVGGGGAPTTIKTYIGDVLSPDPNAIDTALTHHGNGVVGAGDGFGGSAIIRGTTDVDTSFRADIDLDNASPGFSQPLVFFNRSATQSYEVSLSLAYDHDVQASGPDAGIRSDFDLTVNSTKVFGSELVSDTMTGDFFNGPLASTGALLEDDGIFQFSMVLSPGQISTVGLDHTIEGPASGFKSGTVTGNATYFLSLDNVTAVPEPSSVLLGALLVIGIFGKRIQKKWPRVKDRHERSMFQQPSLRSHRV
ncbi:MAG: hypothetical protein AAGD07_15545 [Planctomycetota bacterium]